MLVKGQPCACSFYQVRFEEKAGCILTRKRQDAYESKIMQMTIRNARIYFALLEYFVKIIGIQEINCMIKFPNDFKYIVDIQSNIFCLLLRMIKLLCV